MNSNPSLSPTTHVTPFLLFFETLDLDLTAPLEESPQPGVSPEFTLKTSNGDGNVIVDFDPLKCLSSPNISDFGVDDGPFSIYIDVKKLGEIKDGNNVGVDNNDILQNGGGFVVGSGHGGGGRRKRKEKGKNVIKTQPWKRQRRGQKGCLANEKKLVEPRKSMAPEELAELWASDPKRAKRILANRHSAARSKERKAQHIVNLEENVNRFNSKVTLLNTRLTTNQRETTELAAEKSELKFQLQTMESRAEQIDAQIETLKLEIEWFKSATGEMDSYQTACLQLPPSEQKQLPLLHNFNKACHLPICM